MSQCKTCGAEIKWVTTSSGKSMPIDAKPEKRIVLEDYDRKGSVVDTYTSHFVTCPDAKQHRKTS